MLTRVRIQGRYFEVTDRFTPGQGRRTTGRAGGQTAPRAEPTPGLSEEPRLVISVPKRLLRSAVRRNTVKRVARESWRLATAADRSRLRSPGILVRLIRAPLAPASAPASPSRPPLAAPALFKRLLRADLDAIWAGQVKPSAKPSARRPRGRSSGPSTHASAGDPS